MIIYITILLVWAFPVFPDFAVVANISSNLVAYWDFTEATGQPRISKKGLRHFSLMEGNGPVTLINDGNDNASASIEQGKWLFIPRDSLYELNIFGEKADVTVIAWIKKMSGKPWQAIAGVWDESHDKRQYYLFLNASSKTYQDEMKRYPCKGLLHGHISATGGKTPGETACITYSSSKIPVPEDKWIMVAMTYDSENIKVYIDGKLSSDEKTNPFRYDKGIFNGGKDGADFTVGTNSVGGKMTNQFIGYIDGLAVYNIALSESELKRIQKKGL